MSINNIPSPNKKLGQHYLNNQQTIESICEDFSGKYDGIIEIGPGPGTLTKTLALKSTPLILIEKDERFIQLLKALRNDIVIHQEDALNISQENLVSPHKNIDSWWLVSNLPYNVGTPIMIKYLKISPIKFFTLMFQKEVAQKVCIDIFGNKQKEKEMNSLHALVATFFQINLLKHVAPGEFSPPPKVKSSVISLERKQEPDLPLSSWDSYESFLRKLFSQRRKQLGKVLKQYFPSEKVEHAFNELNIPLTIRSERLNLEQVQNLFTHLG